MKFSVAIAAAIAFTICGTASAQAPSHERLTIVNQCDDDAWAIFTPGGTPQQPEVLANSGAWFRQFAAQEYFIPTGWTGTITANSTMLILVDSSPGFTFTAGQILKIPGAGAGGGDLITPIASQVTGGLVLQSAAQTSVQKVGLLYDKLVGAIMVKGKGAQNLTLAVPDSGAPGANFSFYIGCPSLTDNSQPFANQGCVIGAAAGDLSSINTLFEPTFGCIPGTKTCAFNPAGDSNDCQSNPNSSTCPALAPIDYFDISTVDGFTLPMTVEAAGTNCTMSSKDASMLDLASCPAETNKTLFSTDPTQQMLINGGVSLLTSTTQYQKACVAPHKWFEVGTFGNPHNSNPILPKCAAGSCTSVSYYAGAGCDPNNPRLACPNGSGPQQRVGPQQNGMYAIQNTNWVKGLYALGYSGYTWQYGDGIGSQSCDAGAQIKVTLCPRGGRPYDKTVKWQFSSTTGDCTVAPTSVGGYASLAACQQANMRYTCEDLTNTDPFKVPSALWYADPQATRGGGGYKYADWQALTQMKCDPTFPVSLPNWQDVTNVPICYLYYGQTSSDMCPSPLLGASGGGGGNGSASHRFHDARLARFRLQQLRWLIDPILHKEQQGWPPFRYVERR